MRAEGDRTSNASSAARAAAFGVPLEHLEAWSEATPALLLVVDADKAPVSANRRWHTFYGHPLEEAHRLDWRGFVHEADLDVFRAHWSDDAPGAEPVEAECRLIRRDGAVLWHRVRSAAVRDAEGHAVGWYTTLTDITAQRRARDQRTAAKRHEYEFLAVLAHELRNPLAPLRSAVDVLKLPSSSDGSLARATEVIDRQVNHMSRLLDDLLDVSRVTRGQIQVRLAPCDVASVVRETAEDHRRSCEEQGLTLTVHAPEKAWIAGDATRVSQMLGNLLHNAEKFTEAGGHIDVLVEIDAQTGCVEIAVRDTGRGIDDDLLARLFEPFSQAVMALDRTPGGLGLGLALVRSLAELHGGGVRAASLGSGQGSVFTLSFPTAGEPPAPGADEHGDEFEDGPTRSLCIVVIEDNLDAAALLQTLLEMMGHEVHAAYDGVAGVEIARRIRPNVVLSDLGLPGQLDGYAVARTLRAEPELEGTFLVALSGYGQQEDRQRSAAAGFDDHLVKPADYESLRSLLERIAQS